MLPHVTAVLTKRPTVGAGFAVPSRDLLTGPTVGVHMVDVGVGLVLGVVRVGAHGLTFRDGKPRSGGVCKVCPATDTISVT